MVLNRFVVVTLFAFAFFFRFYNYNNRLIFGPEQAMSLITAGEMIKDKFSLLGEAYIQRATSDGHFLFHSALFSYSLIPLEIIFNFDPFKITVFFTILNLFTGYLLYLILKKELNTTTAIFSTFIFLLNSKMIHHSLFVWTLNYLPLVGLLTIYLLWKLFKNNHNLWSVLFLGILSGVGFGLQYVYVISALVVFLLTVFFTRKKILSILIFLIGATLGELPMVLFDLKHNFYHLNTLYQYLLDAEAHRVTSFYTYYQFLNLWPIFAILGGLILSFVFKKYKMLVIVFIVIYTYTNLTSPFSKITSGQLTPSEINLNTLKKVASIIAKTNPPKKFNLAVLLDFDTRAHPLRYLLTYQYNLKPQPVEKYKDLEALYVLALNDYDMKSPKVWELQEYLPYKITNLNLPAQNHQLYKLTK